MESRDNELKFKRLRGVLNPPIALSATRSSIFTECVRYIIRAPGSVFDPPFEIIVSEGQFLF